MLIFIGKSDKEIVEKTFAIFGSTFLSHVFVFIEIEGFGIYELLRKLFLNASFLMIY
jgi:hypothetical protein